MKGLSSATSFLFVLIILLPPSARADLIDQTCKQTPDFDLCSSTLRSDPQSSNADVKGLANIMANAVLVKANDTLYYMKQQIKQTQDQQLEQALAFCAELFIPLVHYSIPQAIIAFTKGQFGFANYGMSYTAKQVEQCTKRLSSSIDPSLVQGSKLVESLSAIAVAILKQLPTGRS